ncbi:MAG TPA: hypothetical protein EYO45_03845 [Candidatus Marinimicrobia bacterium]|nr:hypothetical protein [Candidatus Neomarinimicrobiota bacterium]
MELFQGANSGYSRRGKGYSSSDSPSESDSESSSSKSKFVSSFSSSSSSSSFLSSRLSSSELFLKMTNMIVSPTDKMESP